jgi:predicted MFS family arabinose efflux permease
VFRLPDPLLFVFATFTGCVPSLGSMVRSRWAVIYRDCPALLHTAYSAESVVDEVCFICGPIVSVGLSTVWFPAAGPTFAALFLAIGVLWLTAQRTTEPVPHPREHHTGGTALRSVGLQVLAATFTATGAIFGAMDVVTVAFADEQGHKAAASVILAAYASGSCLAGLVFGLLRPTRAPARRWLVGICLMAMSMIPLQLVGPARSLPLLAAALFVSGLTVAPTMITTVALVEGHVPRAQLTEGMTWTSTGLTAGVAIGSSVAGWVVDAAGAAAGFVVPEIAGAVAAVIGLVGFRRLKRPAVKRGGTVGHGEREEQHMA